MGFFAAGVRFGPAKPAQGRPSLKRVLNKCGLISNRDGTFAESQLDGALDRPSAPQPGEERELFRLDAAKIDGEIQAMNCQKYLRRFKLRHGTDFAVFSSLLNSIAGNIGRVITMFHFQEQVIHRIMELEELDIRLKA